MDSERIQEEKWLHTNAQFDIIFKTRDEINKRFNIYVEAEELFLVLQEIRPRGVGPKTLGDYFDVREYNLGGKDFENVWELMRKNCEKIVCDLPCGVDIAKVVIETARKMNTRADRFLAEHGYDAEAA